MVPTGCVAAIKVQLKWRTLAFRTQTGYLTMDQTRSLLPLAADDPNVSAAVLLVSKLLS